ncbi:uncharacterized protein MELLADRAFT_35036, partial [Melampsora larici-populina 98AG31]
LSDDRLINEFGRTAKNAGRIILGGDVCKHKLANEMFYVSEEEYAMCINTGQKCDGYNSGATPNKAIDWRKIKMYLKSVKVSPILYIN